MTVGLAIGLAVVSAMAALLVAWALWARPLAVAQMAVHQGNVAGAALTAEHKALRERHDGMAADHSSLRAEHDGARSAHAQVQADIARHEAEARERAHAHDLLREQHRIARAELAVLQATHSEANARLAAHAAAAETRDEAHRTQLETLRTEFEALAGRALAAAQTRFAEQADETLKGHRAEAAAGLEASRVSLAELLTPVRDTLGQYKVQLTEIEQRRNDAYGALREQLGAVAAGQEKVQKEADRLVNALRSSGKTSGAWGELQLENVLEKAGLKRGIDFELQASHAGEHGGRQRPDAVVQLPGGGALIIDSKCSVNDYLSAVEALDEQARQAALKRHADCVRAHVKAISAKAYWEDRPEAVQAIAVFVPGDNLLAAALEADTSLLGWAHDQRVFLVGPTNLLALLTNVALVRRQEKLAEEAEKIGKLAGELYDSIAGMGEHVVKLGDSLGKAVERYNAFVGSLEMRVLPKARRLPDMGAKVVKALPAEIRTIETTARAPVAPELLPVLVSSPPLLAAE